MLTLGSVKKSVTDKERRKVAVKIADSIEEELDGARGLILGIRTDLSNLLDDPDFDAAEIERLAQHYEELHVTKQRRLGDLRFELKEQMTKNEWGRLFDRLRKQR